MARKASEFLGSFGALARNTFRVVVDYSQALHLDKRGTERVDLELLHFDREMTSEEVFCEYKRLDYRPANDRELLAFGCTYEDKLREFPIVAFVVDGDWRVPCRLGYSTNRGLHLIWFGSRWDAPCRFLVVRK